jgi:ABC-type cobalt transport system substrate-binding protein
MKRQLIEKEKIEVRNQQIDTDGTLKCFISGEVIGEDDIIEYDHIQAFAKKGETSLVNIRIVKKEYNRRKSDQSLYDVRDNLKLERLFEKNNKIKLQDIFDLKKVEHKSFSANRKDSMIKIDDGIDKIDCPIFYDKLLEAEYFYARVQNKWIVNDDEKGLQPRYIAYKRLVKLRDHLKTHPQLAPSIARLVDNKIKLFDGQHKFASQILNNQTEIDVKIYISPSDVTKSKQLSDQLMITNLEAHSKHKQIPFYTSTLLDKLAEIQKEFLEKFIETKPPETHTEDNFINFLVSEQQYSKAEAKKMLVSAIKTQAKDLSVLKEYIAIASRDANYPITDDLLGKTIFPNTLYLTPSKAHFKSDFDYRDSEMENFKSISLLLVEKGYLKEWIPKKRNSSLTNMQLKSRRIWHKGSVLTWSLYLRDVIINSCNMMTQDERDKLLYRKKFSKEQIERISASLDRLFNHNLWDEPEGEIDSLLVSAQKQNELFERKGLSITYVLTGHN